MRRTDVVIVGGGQAGLAVSRCLFAAGIEHVVLERGQVAERWRSERWDSLRLLTPNWMTRLPGFQYGGPDPDAFMTAGELVAFLETFASTFPAPVETDTSVVAIAAAGRGFVVTTSRGVWLTRNVVLASLLSRLDCVAEDGVKVSEPFEPLWPAFVTAVTDLDLRATGIETIVWATGYRRTYPWLKIPLLDARGELRHHGGVTPWAGVYAIGLPFQRTRKSAFIDGVGSDARALTEHIAARLRHTSSAHDSTHDSPLAV